MLLQTNNLSVGYHKKILIDTINLSVKEGEILCLLGPNGSGKSTILKTISNHLHALDGVVHICGHTLKELSDSALAREMSVVLTSRISPEMMTCYEIVALGRFPFTNNLGKLTKNDMDIIEDSLKMVGWWENCERYFSDLSDGEKQRVLLARAICQTPKIIVLDEPTSYLDIKHKIALLSILRTLAQEKNIGVVLSLHEVDLAAKTAHRLVLIKDNQIIGYGYPEDILDDKMIRRLYSIEEGNFSLLMGSIELPANDARCSVFVLAGGGYGAPVFRSLQRNNIGFCTGILGENDIDYAVAKASASNIISTLPYANVSEQDMQAAKQIIDATNMVIDCGMPIAEINQCNLALLAYARSQDKPIVSLRDQVLPIEGITYVKTIEQLTKKVMEGEYSEHP